jgi:transposase
MNAYSKDLRKKVVEAAERGTPKAEVARTFCVGVSSVKRYVATAREGRSLAPKRRPGSEPKRRWAKEARGGGSWRRTTSKNARRPPCPKGASSWSGSQG